MWRLSLRLSLRLRLLGISLGRPLLRLPVRACLRLGLRLLLRLRRGLPGLLWHPLLAAIGPRRLLWLGLGLRWVTRPRRLLRRGMEERVATSVRARR